jgi:hypothetical protein
VPCAINSKCALCWNERQNVSLMAYRRKSQYELVQHERDEEGGVKDGGKSSLANGEGPHSGHSGSAAIENLWNIEYYTKCGLARCATRARTLVCLSVWSSHSSKDGCVRARAGRHSPVLSQALDAIAHGEGACGSTQRRCAQTEKPSKPSWSLAPSCCGFTWRIARRCSFPQKR